MKLKALFLQLSVPVSATTAFAIPEEQQNVMSEFTLGVSHQRTTLNPSLDDVEPPQNALDQAIERWQAEKGKATEGNDNEIPIFYTKPWSSASEHDLFDDYVHPGSTSNKTVYQLIMECKYTTIFAALINGYDDIVADLNGTATSFGNVTVFIPIDSEMKRVMDSSIKLSKQDIKEILGYHIISQVYPIDRLLLKHTIISTLASIDLGGQRQRLSIYAGEKELMINHYSRVIAVDIVSKSLFDLFPSCTIN